VARKLIIIIFILFPVLAVAQPITFNRPKNTDSLKKVLSESSGTKRVDLLNMTGYSILSKNPEESLNYITKALTLSDSLGYDDGKAVALWLLSLKKQNIDSSLKYLLKAEKLLNDSTYWVVKYNIFTRIADRYLKINKNDSAIAYYQKSSTEIITPDGFYARMTGYTRAAKHLNISGDYTEEGNMLKMLNELVLKEGYPLSDIKFILYFGKLGSFYTRHGYYGLAVDAHKKILDNLYKFKLTNGVNDYMAAKFLGFIARAYGQWGKYDSAIYYHNRSINKFILSQNKYNRSLKTDKKLNHIGNFKINIANQIEGKAIVQMNTGMYDSSKMNFLRSMEMRKEKNDILGVAMCLDGLGELCQIQGRYTNALEQLDEGLKMKRTYREDYNLAHPKKSSQINMNNMIDESISISFFDKGKLFYDWGKDELAKRQFDEAIKLSRNIGYVRGEAQALMAAGDVYLKQDSMDVAKISYKKAFDIFDKTDNLPEKARAQAKLGDYYSYTRNITKAQRYYHLAQSIFNKLGLQRDLAETYAKSAQLHFQQKEYDKAIDEYQKSIKIATPLQLQKILMEAHKGISDVYSALGKTDIAFEHYKKYIAARDTIFTLEASRQIANLEAIHEAEKKGQEISMLKNENELKQYKLERSQYVYISIGGLALLLIISTILYSRQEKLKASKQNMTLEQKLLRTQMNPHFIFNALTNIQRFMYGNKPAEANTYLTTFAGLMRNILENSKENVISLDKEITTITNYLKLQKLRLGDKLEYSIEVDEAIVPENYQIPPMLAQPFIENAIEHGIIHKKNGGNIKIKFYSSGNYLFFEVTDDGVGREKAAELEKGREKVHVSMATTITKDRLEVINKKLKSKITLKIIDLKDKNNKPLGTKVVITIPENYS